MTSKEALEELNTVLKTNYGTKRYGDIFEEHLIEIIEKDLEVLDKIKRFIEEWAKAEFPSKSGDYYMGEILEVQEYDK